MEIVYENKDLFKNVKCNCCGTKVNLDPNSDDIKIEYKVASDPYGGFYDVLSDNLSNIDSNKLTNELEPLLNASDKIKNTFAKDIKKLQNFSSNICFTTDPNTPSYNRKEYSYICPICGRKNVFKTEVSLGPIYLEFFDFDNTASAVSYKKQYGNYTQYISIDKNNYELIDFITKIGYKFYQNGQMILTI